MATSSAPGPGRHHQERGQSLVEMAILAPVLMALILGIVEVASAYSAYLAVSTASREGARLAARGNVFLPGQVLSVVEEHSGKLNLAADGAVVLTTVYSDPNSFAATTQSLLGSAGSRFDQATLMNLERQVTSSEPGYLRQEQFVVVEVFYTHRSFTGFIGATVPMYAYTAMPVSAPS